MEAVIRGRKGSTRSARSTRSVKVVLIRGDITEEATDAIVNAANSGLLGGGGVDGAIHRAGGPSIMKECRMIGSCPTGSAVITGPGRLKARYVIHAVGPVYTGGKSGEAKLLASAYTTCLNLAAKNGLSSIAFPSISTGAYGYPIREAARVALTAVKDFVLAHNGPSNGPSNGLVLVKFVLFSEADLSVYSEALEEALTELLKDDA